MTKQELRSEIERLKTDLLKQAAHLTYSQLRDAIIEIENLEAEL